MRWTETSEVSLTQCKRILEKHTRGTRLCRYVYEAFTPLYALAEVADIIYSAGYSISHCLAVCVAVHLREVVAERGERGELRHFL